MTPQTRTCHCITGLPLKHISLAVVIIAEDVCSSHQSVLWAIFAGHELGAGVCENVPTDCRARGHVGAGRGGGSDGAG